MKQTPKTEGRTPSNSATAPTKRVYSWERFWISRDGIVDLSDGGFLVDPTSPLRRAHPNAPATLTDLGQYRALVLLGEPGIGKSATLEAEATRVSAESIADETVSIHADLRAYSSDTLLHQRVFGSPEFTAWTKSASHLVLHLDSLDEALLRIDSVANLLASELPRYPTSRMSLRIACRTAVWPGGILEPSLNRLWGGNVVGVFELAPLRRRDVVVAAETLGLDAEAFIRELYAANAVPFAIKPLTLNLLLGLFQRDGRLPRSVAELYTRGCLKLCEEANPSRRHARRLGALNPAQRFRVAARLAAATMLANRYAIWTGPEAAGVPEEDIPLSILARAREEGDFPSFDISEDNVREVLDTGLFTSRGGELMGWAHQSYAEFLAAQYLIEKRVSSSNILKILLHPAGGLVPQLASVTAWIASLSQEIRETLIESEPLVLMQGDLSSWSEPDLAALTSSLLIAFEKKNVRDFIPGIANYYAKLAHPQLAAQLRVYITDPAKNVICRRAAIMIAQSCTVGELQPELLKIALDPACDPDLRARAVAALGTCGDETVPPQMLALARGELGPDPLDGIKGHALTILWPKHLSAAELFATITKPNEGHVGAYVMFLTGTLPDSLTIADFPAALEWAASFVAQAGHSGDFHRKSLADSILTRVWLHIDRREIIAPLLQYVFVSLGGSHELMRGTGRREQEQFRTTLKSDATRRQSFLLAVTKRTVERIDIFHLIRAGLLQREDLHWLLTLCPNVTPGGSSINSETLCNMIEMAFDRDDQSHFQALYDAAVKWPPLWNHFKGVFEGVPLDSADAQQLRKTQQMLRELEDRRPPPVTPPPDQRVANLLNQFEAGEWRAWRQLNRELTLTSTSTVYGDDLEYSITRMPGWAGADATTRQRIVNAADQYLAIGETSIKEWIGTTSINLNDLAAYRAFVLLKELEPAAYEQIPVAIWAKWSPAIAAIPKHTGSERPKLHIEVVADALAAAPAEFVNAIRQIMSVERARATADSNAGVLPGTSFFVLRDLDGCWDSDELKQGIFAELCDETNSEDQFRTILEVLLTAGFAQARDYATAILAPDRADAGPRALIAASALAIYCAEAWPAIWARISREPDFARRFFLNLGASYRFQESVFAELTEQQCAEAYVLLLQLFPPSSDPQHRPGQAHFVGPHESLAHMRDGIIPQIVNRGTPAAVSAMRWIVSQLPDLTWLSFHLRDAEQMMRTKTWSPLSPRDVFQLTDSRDRLLVQSADDLCELLMDTLRRYEAELHGEQTPVRSLWDRQGSGNLFRPIEEDGLSDHVSLYLQRELVERAVVANREVEVGRVPGAPVGKRTDIRIDAIKRSTDGAAFDTITAVIETKGCWNKALLTALTSQLYDDYLVRLRAPVGIYLVGWFDKAKWDPEDPRRAATPNSSLQEMQNQLDAQAAAVPAGFKVRAFVLDCHTH
jgi:hypothetical protein